MVKIVSTHMPSSSSSNSHEVFLLLAPHPMLPCWLVEMGSVVRVSRFVTPFCILLTFCKYPEKAFTPPQKTPQKLPS